VGCSLEVIPGVDGAKVPQPTPYDGATIRILSTKDKRILAEGKTDRSGGVTMAAPPGRHLLEVIPRSKGEAVQSPIEVTVENEKLTGVEITITICAP
jgi:hypothetical protein